MKWRQKHFGPLYQTFAPSKHYSDIPVPRAFLRNAHYKNPGDQLGVCNLLLQWKEVLEVFRRETSQPFGYLLVDLLPASSDDVRVLSHLLKDEGWTRCNQKNEDAVVTK